jgi:hypothetical protein
MKVNKVGKTSRCFGSSTAELGPALWILLILIVIPLIDLISFIWGVSTVMFLANNAARSAAPQQTYSDAIAAVRNAENNLKNWQNFAKLTPVNGQAQGVEIAVLRIAMNNNSSTKYLPPPAPNKIPNDSNALTNNIYQYQIIASYDVMPVFNFSQMPVLSSIPALGKPVNVSFTSTAQVEHPEGLNN